MNLGTFRTMVREVVLADASGLNFSDDVVDRSLSFALQRILWHTAKPKQITYDASVLKADGVTPYNMATDTVFTLPDDMYESLNISGIVWKTDSSGITSYYDPLWKTSNSHPYAKADGKYETWNNDLILTSPVGDGGTLHVRYFGQYTVPDTDEGLLDFPMWITHIVSMLTGYYALTSLSVSSATIDRWKDKSDSGNPEQNALAELQRHLLKQYQIMISEYPVQDRANFFRSV